MIPLKFMLWWSGGNLSYLRYLTFKTLRHFHPNASILLLIGDVFKKDNHKWDVEKQDFEHPENIQKNYIDELKHLNIEVKHVNFFSQYAPNFQSDVARWWWLHNFGGFYLDTDQIILKSFESLPLDNDFIYSGYKADSCGYYTPVGVLGASKGSEIVKKMMDEVPKLIDVNNYNSAGPFALRTILDGKKKWKDRMFNAPSNYFYPISESFNAHTIFNGSFKIPEESYAIHMFLGHPDSQEFNRKYTEIFSKTNNDTISKHLRNEKSL